MFNVVLHLTFEVLHKQGGKGLQDSLKLANGRKTKTANGWPRRERGVEVKTRGKLAGKALEETMVVEERGSEDWAVHIGNPELVLHGVRRAERQAETPLAEGVDDGSISGDKVRGTGKKAIWC